MAERIVGYQRVADPGCCDFCQEVDGAFLKSDDPMPLHNNCGCGVEPITADDPRAAKVATARPGGLPVPEEKPWAWGADEERFSLAVPDDIAATTIEASAADAAREYTGGAYRGLNETLRRQLVDADNEISPPPPLTPEQQTMADALRSQMRGLPDTPTVWRGVDMGPGMFGRAFGHEAVYEETADYAVEKFAVGEVVETGGFQSSSFYVEPGLNAAAGSGRSPGIMLEIRANRGAYLGNVTKFDDEAELLLPDDAKFRVVGVERRVAFMQDDGTVVHRTVVRLEQL